MTINTGTTVSRLLARPNILGTTKCVHLAECNYVLKTAVGGTTQTQREVYVRLGLEEFNITPWMVVADIFDDMILSLDIINKYAGLC